MEGRWPVLVINLNRSPDRFRLMEQRFHDPFIRIEGVDGFQWQHPTETDSQGRPQFLEGAREKLVEDGVLGQEEYWPLIPTEVGCALGHAAAWKWILENGVDRAVVLEDDIVPTSRYRDSIQDSVEMPEDADVLFLTGLDNEHAELALDEHGRLKSGFCNYGYVITYEGAEKALSAQFPMYQPCDFQWWCCAFKGLSISSIVAPIGNPGYAYALEEGIIRIADTGFKSTMTSDGKKPWKRMSA